MKNECFGELYYLPYDNLGEWLMKRIHIISSLYCTFDEKTSELPNGINIYRTSRGYKEDQQIIGLELAKLLVNTYIIKRLNIINQDGSQISYMTPINIVLDTMDSEYITTINKSCIESMKSIINHPYFKSCQNIDDINKSISSIKNLNDLFCHIDKE